MIQDTVNERNGKLSKLTFKSATMLTQEELQEVLEEIRLNGGSDDPPFIFVKETQNGS